jgi:tRNA nucleotidyltransferase (CCA-adding enzyme)
MTESSSSQLEKYLPQPVLNLVKDAGKKAEVLGLKLYLVGGVVRDLLLERPNYDLDMVVEGDAIVLAQEMVKGSQAKITIHQRFGTAKLSYADFSLDFATARSETYSKPGALPTVKPGTIKDDLIRRDFSTNAMAISLMPQSFGDLIDLYQGKGDLKNGVIRILHPDSFTDDATRILRAIRYEQRLGFKLEVETEKLLRRHVPMLDTISGDRIRHEFYRLLDEAEPERFFQRAQELGVLYKLSHALEGNGWLSARFAQTRQTYKRISPVPIYFCLLVYHMNGKEVEQFTSCLNMPKGMAEAMRHTLRLKVKLHRLAEPKLKPSDIYQLLRGYATQAIRANAVATDSLIVSELLKLYLNKLSTIKPFLKGRELKQIGVSEGPKMGELLKVLHEAKLNGEVRTREDEEKLVHSWRQRSG